MKKFMRFLSLICLLAVISALVLGTVALATDFDGIRGEMENSTSDAGGLNTKVIGFGKDAYSLIQTGGNILAVLILLIYGVKWMFATPQKKAELKDRLWNYVIGAALIFGSFNIIGLLANFWKGVLGQG